MSRAQRLQALERLTDDDVRVLQYDWSLHARDTQVEPPGDWFVWLIKPGRGWGKTRTGAETVRAWVETGQRGRIALVNDTAADGRDVMIEGPDGLLAVCPPWNKPVYEPSKRRVTWPNGAVAIAYAAEAPGLLRGPQHDGAWCDELAKWKHLQKTDESGDTAWSNLLMGLRVVPASGARPRCVVTTTPRPIQIIRTLMDDPSTCVTTGAMFENEANLAPEFLRQMRQRFEGTRLGRQELFGDVLEQVEGALWNERLLEPFRVQRVPPLRRIVVGVDPAVTNKATSDETGIVVAGLGEDGHGYVLEDLSDRYSPDGWAKKVVDACARHHADRIVAEVNNGGDLVGYTVRTVDPKASYRAVRASHGKRTRAEPIAALYEQGKVHHVGILPALESQMTTWNPAEADDSPDRVDALVWALSDLMLGLMVPATGMPVGFAREATFGFTLGDGDAGLPPHLGWQE